MKYKIVITLEGNKPEDLNDLAMMALDGVLCDPVIAGKMKVKRSDVLKSNDKYDGMIYI